MSSSTTKLRTQKVGAQNINAVADVNFTVGAEATNVINVVCQAVDADGNDVDEAVCLPYYLSGDSAGQTIGTAHSSAPAVGTDGLLIPSGGDSSLTGLAMFETDGDLDIDFTDTGTGTVYLCIVLPTGDVAISGAITHA